MDSGAWTGDSDGYIVHAVLRPKAVALRQFQVDIAATCIERNTLVVIPTGLGKTVIAALVVAEKMARDGGRALFLAPSRPLADQHSKTLSSIVARGPVACLTGTEGQKKRSTKWRSYPIVAATPQVAHNDIRAGLLPRDFSVVVFDEAHRAVGDYAYVQLAKELRALCPSALFLGLTASPGHELDHVEEVCRNLFIENVVLRSREDADVSPYVQDMTIEWVEVQPTEVIVKVSDLLTKYYHERLHQIRKYGFLRDRKNSQVRIKDLNAVAGQIFKRQTQGRAPYLFQASRQVNLARTALHSILCIERQGVDSFLKFIEPKLAKDRSKADASFVKDRRVQRAYRAAKRWKGTSHPKLEPLLKVIAEQTRRKAGSKVIVFAELRDTVEHLESLIRSNGVRVERFVGQGSREGRKGMTQRQQRETLRRFASGEFQVLCATSIAEEGLDVPQVDLVVFYEPVASDVRLIQRKGRTGRDSPGRVVILTTDRTADEGYLHAGIRRERRMKRMVKRLAQEGIRGDAKATEQESVVEPRATASGNSAAVQRTIDDYDESAA
ncbi:MAG: helicase-related protein [Thermoplasmata archaeon]